jgi:hypothetical protein
MGLLCHVVSLQERVRLSGGPLPKDGPAPTRVHTPRPELDNLRPTSKTVLDLSFLRSGALVGILLDY